MSKKFLKICTAFFMLILIAGATVGCNTMHGVGEDMEEAGEAIEDAAE